MKGWNNYFFIFIATISIFGEDMREGKLTISIFGNPYGYEEFRMEKLKEGKIVIETVGKMNAKIIGREIILDLNSKLLLSEGYRAEKYELYIKTKKGTTELNITLQNGIVSGEVIKNSLKNSQKIKVDPLTLILDNNVFAHYFVLVERYDFRKAGKQKFPVLVPQNGFQTEISVEDRGYEETKLGEEIYLLRRLFADLGGLIGINIWIDDNNELLKVQIANKAMEIFRENYVPVVKKATGTKSKEEIGCREEKVIFESKGIKLAGILSFPVGKEKDLPAVIIISGSGPQNCDGNSPDGFTFQTDIYRDIAIELSKKGFAVLRYDDRGVGKSEGNFQTSIFSDFLNDAKAALAFLKTRTEIDKGKILLLGHSEGGIIASIIASEDPSINQILLMGTPAKSLKHVLKEQLDLIKDEKLRKITECNQEILFKAVEEGLDWKDIDGRRVFLGWFREHFQLDPLKIISKVKCPVSILHGRNDIQVLPYHALLYKDILEKIGVRYRIKIFDDLDHLFMKSESKSLSYYFDSKRKVDRNFLDTLLAFIEANLER